MSKKAVAIGVALALVVVAIVLRGRVTRPATPEATINALFEAAARGDDGTYMGLISGALRKSLEETRSQVGAEKFRRNLRDSVAGLKGLAVSAGRDAPPGQVALDVELVFADRNERQRILLASEGTGWVIVALSAGSGQKPRVPYGTPVYGDQP